MHIEIGRIICPHVKMTVIPSSTSSFLCDVESTPRFFYVCTRSILFYCLLDSSLLKFITNEFYSFTKLFMSSPLTP